MTIHRSEKFIQEIVSELKMNEAADKSNSEKGPESAKVSEETTKSQSRNRLPLKSRIPMTSRNQSNAESSSNTDLSSRRRTSKSSPSPGNSKRPNAGTTTQKRIYENQMSTKKKTYMALKQDLAGKQKKALEMYEDIMQLREKLIACGVKDPGTVEELKFVEIGSLKQQPPGNAPDTVSNLDSVKLDDKLRQEIENPTITRELLHRIQENLKELTLKYDEVNREILNKYNRLKRIIQDESNSDELKAIVQQDDADLLKNLEEVSLLKNTTSVGLAKFTSDLYDQCESYKDHIKTLHSFLEKQQGWKGQMTAAHLEMQCNEQNKIRRAQLESHLSSAKMKIRELEAKVTADEELIQQMQASIKSTEEKQRTKEQIFERKAKDQQKTIKNHEGIVFKLEKQRNSFESRLLELKKEMGHRETDLTGKIKALTSELETEKTKRSEAETSIADLEKRHKQMEKKCEQLFELTESMKMTNIDNNYTENEVRLYNDLKNIREELAKQKDMVDQLQKEKQEILSMMHRAASESNEDETKHETNSKLAAELAIKSNDLRNLAQQRLELEKAVELAQSKNELLEKELAELRNHMKAQIKDGGKNAPSTQVLMLQQELSDLREALAEQHTRNKKYEWELLQKQLELETRDRMMRDGSKALKLKDELSRLKNHELPDEFEDFPDTDETDKSINIKQELIEQLTSALENKQLQVMKLETVVKQMEDQEDRAQAQRTRLENRIAELQLTLQGKLADSRNRGFGIL